MTYHVKYKGIFFMLLAALGFSIMGGAAKSLKGSFNAGQLVFFRNAVGFVILTVSLINQPPVNKGKKFILLFTRGLLGTTALYMLLYCILHIPLGTSMTYNLTSVLHIAWLSWLFLGERNGKIVAISVVIGFIGMVLIYKPSVDIPIQYHIAGFISGLAAGFAYLTVGKLNLYYDARIIVLSFILTGVLVPLLFMLIRLVFSIPADELFFIEWRNPEGIEWVYVLILGFAALFGQYFVTKAYGIERAGIVSAVSYANIIFSVIIGVLLGDAFPDPVSLSGILLIILSGVLISLYKRRNP